MQALLCCLDEPSWQAQRSGYFLCQRCLSHAHPCNLAIQSALLANRLLGWLSGNRLPALLQNFRGSHLVGQDVVAALRAELAAQGLHVTVPAIVNDTVATLVGAVAVWLRMIGGCCWLAAAGWLSGWLVAWRLLLVHWLHLMAGLWVLEGGII